MFFTILIKLIVLVYLTFLGSFVSAGSTKYFYNGTKLYNLCRAGNATDEALCEGYILGVQDAIYSGYLSDHFSVCLPEGVEPDQIRLMLIRFIENNPDIMNFAAEGLVAKTLETFYSCKK
tara:strand:- start:316 stop:675 length:360 start_codon:yes stop_codon:yes gene_type:complete